MIFMVFNVTKDERAEAGCLVQRERYFFYVYFFCRV